MNEQKEFDRFLKKMLDKNPEIPSELGWDKMGFVLPNPEKKKKKNGKRYLFLFFLIFIGTGMLMYFYNQNYYAEYETITSSQNTNPDLRDDLKNEAALAPISCDQNKKSSIRTKGTISTEENLFLEDTSILVQESTRTSSTTKHLPLKTSQTNNQKGSDWLMTTSSNPGKIGFDTANINAKNDFEIVTEQIESLVAIPQNTTSEIIEKLPEIPTSYLYYENELALGLTIDESHQLHYEKGDNKPNSFCLMVGYGYNYFTLNVEDLNILRDKISSELGQIYSIGLKYNINEKWHTEACIKYEQYHTTFEHSRELEPILDVQNAQTIYREELTFNNNYTNTLGLQLGATRVWKITDQIQLHTGLVLSPIYTLSIEGKTTTGIDVVSLGVDNQMNRLALTGGGKAALATHITPSTSLALMYQHNRFLIGDIFINNGISITQQNAVTIYISYQFGL